MGKVHLVRKPFEIEGGCREVVRGDLRYKPSTDRLPVVVICHSFMAFKNWGFFPYLAECLAEAGFASIVFNFSHNGIGEEESRITQFEKFRRNTVSLELQDLQKLIDAIWADEFSGGITDAEHIGLMGHSRGGGLAILQCSRDPRIRSLVSWSSIATFDRWTRHQKENWKRSGYHPLAKDSSISPLRLDIGLLNDLEQNREEFDLRKAAGKIHVPWLIIHGTADVLVPVREAEQLYTASDPLTTRLDILDQVGHLYRAATPDDDGYRTIDPIIDRTVQWFHSSLS